MPLTQRPLDSIEESDLKNLIDNKVSERKILEYKQSLPGSSHDEKKEFAADVSSFANASGGHLIYGMSEENGIPVSLCGLQGIDADAQMLRLENILRDCVEPRISGIKMHVIPLQTGGSAIIVRIPRSWALPHVAKHEKHWRFYSRNSAGKYPLDVGELRAAFALSETTSERIRNFRIERLSRVVSRETPIALNNGPKIILHLIPFNAFDPASKLDISILEKHLHGLALPYLQNFDFRYNFDGILSYARPPEVEVALSYLQIYRNGIIECVDTYILAKRTAEFIIDIAWLEEELLKALPRFLSNWKKLGVEPPFLIMLSLLGVSGLKIHVSARFSNQSYPTLQPIDRDTLLIPEIMMDSFDIRAAEMMRPAFDAIWNAAGWPRSMFYDEEGKRRT